MNDFTERFSIQTRTAYQCAIDIGHAHQFLDIVRFYATPIQYSDGFGKYIPKTFFNLFTQKAMNFLSLRARGGFARPDRPDRLVREDRRFQVVRGKTF